MTNNQMKFDAIKAVSEWNKLLVGLNAGMGGGCLTILQNSPAQGLTRTFLVLAIIAFVGSMLCTVVMMGQALAAITVLSDEIPTVGNIYGSGNTDSQRSMKILARLQLITFVFACLFLGIWVALKLA
jgi:preprotein translocase subunit SecG